LRTAFGCFTKTFANLHISKVAMRKSNFHNKRGVFMSREYKELNAVFVGEAHAR
jgi:hypothetical protein